MCIPLLDSRTPSEWDRKVALSSSRASTVLETAPENSVLVTRNTVQLALAADGLRPDVDIVHQSDVLLKATSLIGLRPA